MCVCVYIAGIQDKLLRWCNERLTGNKKKGPGKASSTMILLVYVYGGCNWGRPSSCRDR
jgi:hypothetical protein